MVSLRSESAHIPTELLTVVLSGSSTWDALTSHLIPSYRTLRRQTRAPAELEAKGKVEGGVPRRLS